MGPRAIIFDFDGVLCESVGIKAEAFRRLFEDYPQHLETILAYHMANGGLNRFKKFEVIYRDMLKEDLSEEKKKELGRRFTDYCYEGVVAAPLVQGACAFLEEYHAKILLFVASGTPQEEIAAIVQERGLEKFFKEVHGSPATKNEIIKNILQRHSIKAQEAVFVGDSINDYYGAREAGVAFVARIHKEYPNPFLNVDVDASIEDISQLDELIRPDAFENVKSAATPDYRA